MIGKQHFRFAKLSLPNSSLRYTEHENGHLIDFYYLIDRNWSKNLRKQEYQDGIHPMTTVGEKAVQVIAGFMGSEPFAFSANKDGMLGFPINDNVQLLPNTPHGLNNYQGFHNYVCLSAQNPTPSLLGFFQGVLSMSFEQVQTAIYRTAVYQAMMRISVRNPLDTNKKR